MWQDDEAGPQLSVDVSSMHPTQRWYAPPDLTVCLGFAKLPEEQQPGTGQESKERGIQVGLILCCSACTCL